MTGARFVHDTLEDLGWDVLIADAEKVKPFGSVACKTDKVDSQVLARLSQLSLIPEIWLPDPRVREERELTRYRMHLVKHRSTLKHRIHATLMTFGRPCPVTDLFGVEGRRLLDRLEVPEPWRSNVSASLELMDELDRKIADCNARLEAGHADHPYVPLLRTVPGIGKVLAFTIASEIGEISRFASASKLVGYAGLAPRINQSGERSATGSLSKAGSRTLRWAAVEAANQAWRASNPFHEHYLRIAARHGKNPAKSAVARKPLITSWHMLSRGQVFQPARRTTAPASSSASPGSERDTVRAMSEENLEIVRRGVEALNRIDVDAFLVVADPTVKFESYLAGGTEYGGHDGLREYFQNLDDAWEDFEVKIDEYRDAGDVVAALGHLRAKGRASGVEVARPLGWVVTLSQGLATRVQIFLDHAEALEAAGLSE